jgi:hypothetical protein
MSSSPLPQSQGTLAIGYPDYDALFDGQDGPKLLVSDLPWLAIVEVFTVARLESAADIKHVYAHNHAALTWSRVRISAKRLYDSWANVLNDETNLITEIREGVQRRAALDEFFGNRCCTQDDDDSSEPVLGPIAMELEVIATS